MSRPVNHRSDIFAFGAVLYEMLAGQRAFGRNTGADTLSAILRGASGVARRQFSSISLRRLTRQCLEKSATMRFRCGTRHLALILGDVEADGPAEAAVGPAARRPRILIAALCGAGACLLAGALGATLWYRNSPPGPPRAGAMATMKLWLPPGRT